MICLVEYIFFGKQYKMKKHDGVCVHVRVPVLLVHLLL